MFDINIAFSSILFLQVLSMRFVQSFYENLLSVKSTAQNKMN